MPTAAEKPKPKYTFERGESVLRIDNGVATAVNPTLAGEVTVQGIVRMPGTGAEVLTFRPVPPTARG